MSKFLESYEIVYNFITFIIFFRVELKHIIICQCYRYRNIFKFIMVLHYCTLCENRNTSVSFFNVLTFTLT